MRGSRRTQPRAPGARTDHPPNQTDPDLVSSPAPNVTKIPPMAPNGNVSHPLPRYVTRRAASLGDSLPSGSEYHGSEKSMEVQEKGEEEQSPQEFQIAYIKSSRGRTFPKRIYRETSEEPDHSKKDNPQEDDVENLFAVDVNVAAESDDEEAPRRRPVKRRTQKKVDELDGFIVSDDDRKTYNTRSQHKPPPPLPRTSRGRVTRKPNRQPVSAIAHQKQRSGKLQSKRRQAAREEAEAAEYVHRSSSSSADAEGELDDVVQTSSDGGLEPAVDADADADGEGEGDVEQELGDDGKKYSLRRRAPIDYRIPAALEDMPAPPPRKSDGPRRGGGGKGRGSRTKGLGWSATGAELGRWMGLNGDDSDSDTYMTRTPRKPFGAPGGLLGAGAMGGGLLSGDLAAAGGTPSNLGKIGDASFADADPLGINANVTFDEVGGLDDHIHALKEMTLLPLLYPEVFQRFSITPPRGVLFHGPPGTGKTLMARALAASCRTGGKGISFFMRKGADCLSKWVGEAERQLRLLFEEAKNCQPSIIFFDEIDGLAPVRSSKQDQIHASIVSTLLALMDGMDGRGQVVVIGATNRPDAVDPALRRPGRFDREFYFGLPSLEAREKILSIMVRKWEGWDGPEGQERIKGLASLTKGYGGADLRALCTEAALNAIQRRYPQIYKSNDRLLLKPETINIGLRDFMFSIKKLVPSSMRSSTSAAAPLPSQLVPLLGDAFEKVKSGIEKIVPLAKKRTAWEEAEYEDGDEQGALEREMLSQSLETLKVYRPRMVIHGRIGMGQAYVGAAALHYLEGYHVQSLELGSLFGDSTRTVEAAIVQLFVEAKRHQPSVIYIPSLVGWCAAVPETARSTVRAMLDTLSPNNPILLLGVVDGPFSELPPDVRAWFGLATNNEVEISSPTVDHREEFFEGLLKDVQRPPNEFSDGVPRRKRILEELPIAPPLEPRQPTAAELAAQEESDQRVVTLLKYRLGPILTELKRKFKRFTKRASDEYDFGTIEQVQVETVTATSVVPVENPSEPMVDVVEETFTTQPAPDNDIPATIVLAGEQAQQVEQLPPLFDMDLERMHIDLYKGKYLTPQDFLDDIHKIVYNAAARQHEDLDRLYKAQAMLTAAEVSIHDFDPQLRLECDKMAARERQRRQDRKKNKEKGKAVDQNGQSGETYAPGTRRSARHNGQQPELGITDPLKLERRLKRLRAEDAAMESMASEEEHSDVRTTKRSRVGSEDDSDPLDIVGPTSIPRPVRSAAVRFALEVEPMAPLHAPQVNGLSHPEQASMGDQFPLQACTGFDPSLFNPLPGPEDVFSASSSSQGADLTPLTGDGESFTHAHPSGAPIAHLPTNLPPSPSQDSSFAPLAADQPAPSSNPFSIDRPPTPMVVERTPTPPHPDFYVDEQQLSRLRTELKGSTHALNVEQLEQLRATCLEAVWRHRSEWDRDELIRELFSVLRRAIGRAEERDGSSNARF